MTTNPIFTPEQLSAIENAPLFAGDRHPAWSVLFEGKSAVDFMTRRALDAIVWSSDLQRSMRGTLDRAVDPSNVSDAAAALAELRALSGLMEAGLLVQPLAPHSKRGATPDFEADAGDGAPVLEEGNPKIRTMGHDGRFRLSGKSKSYYAAAIVCFEKGLVLFENPWATIPLPAKFRRHCERLPWFKIGHSIADWTPTEALTSVTFSERRICALSIDQNM